MNAYELNLEPTANPGTESAVTPNAVTPNYQEIIETVIASLQEDQSAMVSQGESGHVWKFKYGSVEVFVQLRGMTDEDELAVWAAVMKLPARDEAGLMQKLMELNWTSTLEARFAVVDSQVVVCAKRTLAGLSPAEVSRNITIVATVADDNDEALQAQFG
ncbi:MAG: YbjN domain-containing protein [Leptolyngbyaceae cyanobacterium CRU_2_3]|nr:YbjN domain-containing protein [Leptolyngbyaceae cyanobacterium CRU_2_3]